MKFVYVLVLSAGTLPIAGCAGASPSSTADAESVGSDAGSSTESAVGEHAGDAPSFGADARAFITAPHAPAPQVVSRGGRVLASPRIIPITFDGDPWRTDIEAFVAGIGLTDYWKATATEYGVGPAQSGTPIRLLGPAPATITHAQFASWLAQKLDGTHPEWPLPDGSTIYAMYYPPGTSYVLFGETGVCVDGDDWYITLSDGTKVPYIVMPRCPPWPGIAPWDSFTWTQSHEFLEESTDPTKDAYYTVDADHMAWSWNPPLAEIGDMCDYPWELTTARRVEARVQRVWSNRAAAAGNDPCVPAPDGPYFNAAPVLTETIPWFNGPGDQGTTKGVKIPVGQTRTIEVDLFSNAPTPSPWQVDALDFNAEIYATAPDLELSLDRSTGSNGDKLNLTIKALKAGYFGGSQFILTSTLSGRTNYWVGLVGN